MHCIQILWRLNLIQCIASEFFEDRTYFNASYLNAMNTGRASPHLICILWGQDLFHYNSADFYARFHQVTVFAKKSTPGIPYALCTFSSPPTCLFWHKTVGTTISIISSGLYTLRYYDTLICFEMYPWTFRCQTPPSSRRVRDSYWNCKWQLTKSLCTAYI